MRRRAISVLLVAYGAILLCLLPRLSLWLDEILDMMGSSKHLPEVVQWAAINPGGVPLGYIIHWASFQILGISAFSARLPSAIASVMACLGIFFVGRRAGLRTPILAVVIFALLPLQFRYALEARPYAIALAISVWAIAVFDQILDRPRTVDLIIYGLLAICGLYVQPYSVFILAAQALFVLISRRDLLAPISLTLGIAVAVFLPWVLYAGAWSTPLSIVEGDQATGWRSLGLIAHEITGMGYPGTILAALGVAAGWRWMTRRSLWLLYLTIPIAGAIVFDLAFGYFLAIRQMIYAILPITILFTCGIESLTKRWPRPAAALLAALIAGSLYADARMFYRPRENWKAVAAELEGEARQGACLVFVPANFEVYYTFFSPALSVSKCAPGPLPPAHRIAVAIGTHEADLTGLYAQGLNKLKWEHGPPQPPYVREFSTR